MSIKILGIIQTFNFAENGRHLANQNYRSCIRQETKMCSIQYEPCDDNSFGIGPMTSSNGMVPLSDPTNMNGNFTYLLMLSISSIVFN